MIFLKILREGNKDMKKCISFVIIVMFIVSGCSVLPKKKTTKKEEYIRLKGMNQFESGEYKMALDSFLKAYEMDSENVETLKGLGLVYIKLNDFEKGKRYFDKVLEKDKNNFFILQNISVYYYNNGNYELAKKYIENIYKAENSLSIKKLKAYIYYKLEEYEKSYVELSDIMDNYDEFYNYDLYAVYVDVLKRTKRSSKVYDFLQNLYLENPNELIAVILFSEYLKEVEVYEKAIDVLKSYGVRNNFESLIVYELSYILYLSKRYVEAGKYINLISEAESYETKILELKIKIYEKLGREEEVMPLKKILIFNKRDDEQ